MTPATSKQALLHTCTCKCTCTWGSLYRELYAPAHTSYSVPFPLHYYTSVTRSSRASPAYPPTPSHPEPSRAIPSHPESTNPQAAAVLSVTLSSGAAHQSARRGEGGLTRRTATRVAVGQVCVCVCVLRGGEVGARVWGCATSKYVSQWSVPYLPLSGFTPPVCQVCQADS